MENFETGRNKKSIIVGIVVLVALLLFSTFTYWYFNLRNVEIADQNDDVQEEGVPEDNTVTEDGGINLQEEVIALNLKYNDAIGWLKIGGTALDTAIYQSSDNNRYLRHNKDNDYDVWGEEFLDYRNNIDNMDNMSHFIIYGHNSEDDRSFGPIFDYKNEDFYKDHKIIEFSTLNGNYKWEIFAVYQTTTDFFYIDTVFANKDEYSSFLNLCKSKSMYDTGVSVDGDSTVLTLSTCDYFDPDGRFVIQAKLIK